MLIPNREALFNGASEKLMMPFMAYLDKRIKSSGKPRSYRRFTRSINTSGCYAVPPYKNVYLRLRKHYSIPR